MTRARVAAAVGQRDEADRILANFVEAHPSTPEAREAAYWRAILRLEVATSRAGRDEAKRNLDTYLADTAVAAHVSEARILRTLLTTVDSTSLATDSTTAAARGRARQDQRGADAHQATSWRAAVRARALGALDHRKPYPTRNSSIARPYRAPRTVRIPECSGRESSGSCSRTSDATC